MSIFGKKPEDQSQGSNPSSPTSPPSRKTRRSAPEPAGATTGRSYLGAGCELTGEFTGAGSFDCSGSFDGTINISGDVVIGHGGTAKAQIKARRISIDGKLHGDATGTEKVEVGASGHVEGDVRAPAVQFAEGAFFEGNVEMRRLDGADDEGEAAGDGEADREPSAGARKDDATAQPSVGATEDAAASGDSS
jgi:cytoskeletal protein CcmA (bactofilin family)